MPLLFLLALLGSSQEAPRPELLVVYGLEDPYLKPDLMAAVRGLRLFRAESIEVVAAKDAGREILSSAAALVLVGTPAANPWITEMARGLPIDFGASGLRFRETRYEHPLDSLQLVLRNPRPLAVLTGNSDRAVLGAVEGRPRAGLRLRRGGRTRLLGQFRADGSLDPESVRELAPAATPGLATRHFAYFIEGYHEPGLPELARRNDSVRERIEALYGAPPAGPRREIRLYRSLEEKGLVTGDTRVAHVEGADVHAVLGIDRTPERTLAELLLPARLPPVLSRGLATVLAHDARELDLLDRLSRGLLSTSDPPRLLSLENESPYVVEALTASFARFAIEQNDPWGRDLESLQRAWRRRLENLPAAESIAPSPPASFQRGFTFAHEGFDVWNGYLSRRSERSLERLASLGVDALAIVPYTFRRDPGDVSPFSVPVRAGAETDEDVVQAVLRAKQKGMTVLLKPQIWLRGSWPGELDPATPEDLERFFREYGRWIRHYALMAERHEVPILAIGTELSKLTRSRLGEWKRLVADLRAIYRGKLVYAANWGEEVERVEFWPLLDYIGVDFYYPLSDAAAPTDEALRAELERVLARLRALSRRHGKPVLLTEIGYASTKAPWRSPHASDRQRELSFSDQARAYELAFSAIERETDWIRGMYWWKWPTDPELGGPEDRGFTPIGKAAEEVVRRWYRGRLQ